MHFNNFTAEMKCERIKKLNRTLESSNRTRDSSEVHHDLDITFEEDEELIRYNTTVVEPRLSSVRSQSKSSRDDSSQSSPVNILGPISLDKGGLSSTSNAHASINSVFERTLSSKV